MINSVMQNMITYYKGDPKRVQHFLKVHSFSKYIGNMEGLSPEKLEILEVAALTHDIGIRISEEKYGECGGKLQELEGPVVANQMLKSIGFEKDFIDRVCFLIGHHHTYDNIVGVDYQILVEADFLVNIFESRMEEDNVESVKTKIFKTKTGVELLELMFQSVK